MVITFLLLPKNKAKLVKHLAQFSVDSEIGDITGHTDPRMLQRYYNKRTSEFVQRFKASFIR